MSWAELARRACAAAGIEPASLEERSASELGLAAARPVNSALTSERGLLLPSFEDALARYLRERETAGTTVQAEESAHYAS
jgi:dTDP-4-dehydrorhamnose reductase